MVRLTFSGLLVELEPLWEQFDADFMEKERRNTNYWKKFSILQ